MITHRLDACPACGASDAREQRLGEHRLRRCGRCELVYAAEYADPDEVFTDGYLTEDSRFGLDVLDPWFQRFLAHAGDERMRALAENRPPPGRFLDVGCGTGEVLAAAVRAGWEAVGVEPVLASVEHGRSLGLDVRHGMVEDTDLEPGSFDVVGAFHVLEHLTDAQAFLRLLASYARPGGMVVVEVPNWDSRFRRGHGEGWPHLRPLEHLAHFTPDTLRATLRAAGLAPVRITTPNYLWSELHLSQELSALGRTQWLRRLARFSTVDEFKGQRVRRPNPMLRRFLAAVDRRDQRRSVGQVVFSVSRTARAPEIPT